MTFPLSSFLLQLTVLLLPVIANAGSPTAKAKPPPSFSFATSAKDSHVIELNDWAARNRLHDANAPEGRKRLRLTVIGCNAPGVECLFVHEGDARVSVFDPRLRKDWAVSLKQELPANRVREMTCVSVSNVPADDVKGECTVTLAGRTREELRQSSPAVARVIGSARGPSATINLIRKKRR